MADDDALSVGIVCADKTNPLSVDDFTAIGYIDLNDPDRTIKSLDELDLNRSGEVSIVSAIFSRASQYSQTVSFYLHVSGGILISSIRFQELKVTSTDLLFLPTDVNKVKIKYTDMQVYALDYASYYSVAPVFGTLTIN